MHPTPHARLTPLLALIGLLGGSLAPSSAIAQDEAPEPDRARVHGVIQQQVVALLNPMGAEHQLRVGLRAPLGDPNELLFTGTHAEAGIVSYFSPVYAIQGGYLEVSPLAFLVLRAELTGAAVWPIGMSGAGYYAVQGYQADVSSDALPAEDGGTAGGWTFSVAATLQGLVPLGPVNLLIWNQLNAQHITMGGASHFYSMMNDLILAQQDWLIENDALLLVEGNLTENIALRVGAYDNVRYVPSSGYVGHQLGPMAMLVIDHPSPEVAEVTPFLRGGYYTDHLIRAGGFTILGGVSVSYDLGAIR